MSWATIFSFIPALLLWWCSLYFFCMVKERSLLSVFHGEDGAFTGRVRRLVLWFSFFWAIAAGGFGIFKALDISEWNKTMSLVVIGFPVCWCAFAGASFLLDAGKRNEKDYEEQVRRQARQVRRDEG